MKRSLILFLTFFLSLLASPFVFAAAPSSTTPGDYNFVWNVAVTNDSSVTTDWFPYINNSTLLATDYVETDTFEDIFTTDLSNTFIESSITSSTNSTDATWWLRRTVDPSNTEISRIYTGNASVTRDFAFGFDGTDDRITVPDDASLDFLNDFIISATITLDSVTSSLTNFTGGTETEAQGYRIHTFTSSDTLTLVSGGTVNYVCIGGGGAGGGVSGAGSGGAGGGGGAGELEQSTVSITATQTITIGAGGVGGTDQGASGSASSIGALVSCAGGGGGGGQTTPAGVNGGDASGGGGGCSEAPSTGTGGTGTQSEGGDANATSDCTGGGGGGATANGANATDPSGGNGGAGSTITLPDNTTLSLGGGGGGSNRDAAESPGSATHGGGAGGDGTTGNAATANSGGGGGGGGNAGGTARNGGDGGSGIVVIWYRASGCIVCKEDAYNLVVDGATITGDVLQSSTATPISLTGLSADTELGVIFSYTAHDGTLLLRAGGSSVSTALTGDIDTSTSVATVGLDADVIMDSLFLVDATAALDDLTSTDAHAQLVGTVPQPDKGPGGDLTTSLRFLGVSQASVSSDTGIVNNFDGGGSYEVWVKPTTCTGGETILYKNGSLDGVRRLQWNGSDCDLRFFSRFSAGNGEWVTTETLTKDEWNHVAVTWDADAAANNPLIYIDGVSATLTETSTPSGTRTSDSGGAFTVGNANLAASGQCDCSVGPVAIWDDIRSPAEVLSSFTNFTRYVGTEANLVGYWTLDGATVFFDFQPGQVAETAKGDVTNSWEWTGTVTNLATTTIDGSYSLFRDTQDLVAVPGPVIPNFIVDLGITDFTITDLVGDFESLTDIVAAPSTLIFFDLFDASATSMGIDIRALYFFVIGLLAWIVAAATDKLTGRSISWLGVGIFVLIIILGAVNDAYPLILALLSLIFLVAIQIFGRALRTGDV